MWLGGYKATAREIARRRLRVADLAASGVRVLHNHAAAVAFAVAQLV